MLYLRDFITSLSGLRRILIIVMGFQFVFFWVSVTIFCSSLTLITKYRTSSLVRWWRPAVPNGVSSRGNSHPSQFDEGNEIIFTNFLFKKFKMLGNVHNNNNNNNNNNQWHWGRRKNNETDCL
jgi:hypothetical protein